MKTSEKKYGITLYTSQSWWYDDDGNRHDELIADYDDDANWLCDTIQEAGIKILRESYDPSRYHCIVEIDEDGNETEVELDIEEQIIIQQQYDDEDEIRILQEQKDAGEIDEDEEGRLEEMLGYYESEYYMPLPKDLRKYAKPEDLYLD